ncbi:MAG: tyrosine recombinase XerC [Tissierellia bacterium]|nr:tyrosine recombinase XerC [Tissierellia bacterium]
MQSPIILEDYLNYMRTIKGSSTSTIKEYRYDLTIFLKYIKARLSGANTEDIKILDETEINSVDSKLIESISINDLYSYLSYLDKCRENSPRTRARKVSAIKSFYDYLYVKSDQISVNPTEKLESPKQFTRNPVYLTLGETQKLLAKVHEMENPFIRNRDYCIIFIFLNCGIRLSELISIDLDDIKDDILTVIGKGNKERTVYLNNSCIIAINQYLAVRPKVENEKALFLSERNKRISKRAVQYRIEKYIKEINLDPRLYSVHKLRHTAATLLYKYGDVDIRALQDILGHESVATTQIYTHLDDEDLKKAVDKNPLNIPID